MTPRFRAALVALLALGLGTAAVWLLVRSGSGALPVGGGGAVDRPDATLPASEAPPPVAGTTPPGGGGVEPGTGPLRTAGGVEGLRVPEGVDLRDPATVLALLRETLADRPTDWKRAALLLALLDGRLDEEVRARLLAEIRTGDRLGVKEALAVARDGTLVPDLFDLLDESELSAGARAAILDVLARMPGANTAEVVRGLEARLTGTPMKDAVLLRAIGRRGGREAGRAIVEYLQSNPDPLTTPGYGFLGLDLKGDAAAAGEITRALASSTSPDLTRALIAISAQPGAALLVEPLVGLDRDGQDDAVRAAAVAALATIGTDAAVARLLEVAAQPGVLGEQAVRSLGTITSADAAARERLMKALEEVERGPRPEQARIEILSALGSLHHAPATPALRAALDDPNPNVRTVAVVGLGQMGESARPHVADLVRTYDQGDEATQRSVILALGGIGGDEARAFLTRLQGQEDLPVALQRALRVALSRLGPSAGPDEGSSDPR